MSCVCVWWVVWKMSLWVEVCVRWVVWCELCGRWLVWDEVWWGVRGEEEKEVVCEMSQVSGSGVRWDDWSGLSQLVVRVQWVVREFSLWRWGESSFCECFCVLTSGRRDCVRWSVVAVVVPRISVPHQPRLYVRSAAPATQKQPGTSGVETPATQTWTHAQELKQ